MESGICVKNNEELLDSIELYRNNPNFLSKEREKYSKIILDHRGISSKIFVDTLERLKYQK
jgi:hypothetical protein